MNISRKDLNLLILFKILYEERNLSRAADRISLSQPALSHKLSKLRNEFNDELFVRAARGLTPTPLAHRIAKDIIGVVASVETLYQGFDSTDFLNNKDVIHIYTTDFIEQLLLPRLLPLVHNEATNLQIVTHNTKGEFPKAAMEKGQCDLAIAGFFNDLPDTFYEQTLRRERFVVLASKHNKEAASRLTLDSFLKSPHIVTTLTGDLQGIVDKKLAELNLTRKVVAGISSFAVPPMVVEQTSFLLTCLKSIALKAQEKHRDLIIHECPVDIPEVQICQIWHQRTQSDPMRRWLRGKVHLLMSDK